jgi:hypothetical protein
VKVNNQAIYNKQINTPFYQVKEKKKLYSNKKKAAAG